jgi:hypothetical protein
MRKLLLVALLVILPGCVLINAYNMARFDNNEYMLINTVRTQANLGAAKCGTPEVVSVVDNIWFKTIELRNYSESIPNNKEAIKMTQELSEIVKGLSVRYHGTEAVSLTYCTTKFSNIEKNATIIQNVIGAKPR